MVKAIAERGMTRARQILDTAGLFKAAAEREAA